MIFRSRVNKKIYDSKNYATAKPGAEEYRKAKEIINNLTITKGIEGYVLVDVIAYLLKYKNISGKDAEARDKSDNIRRCSRCLATAPWMASESNEFYVDYLNYLLDEGILEYDSSIDLLYMKNSIDYNYDKIELKKVEDSFNILYEFLNRVEQKDAYITIKMSVFHARTFMDFLEKRGQPIHMLLERFHNLNFQILCVGKRSGRVAREGADDEYLEKAISEGVVKLYKIASKYKRRFQIRFINDDIVDASLRTTICINDNEIFLCHFDYWRVGIERGIHGSKYAADIHSSLALQMNRLFDDAFGRAIPIKLNFSWVRYQLRRIVKWICAVLIIFALNLIILNAREFFGLGLSSLDVIKILVETIGIVVLTEVINKFGKKLLQNY